MQLGETILRLRTQRGMSQEELAAAVEVSRQSVSKWETNASVPEVEKLVKLGALFGVTLDELVLGEKAEAPAEPAPPPGEDPPAPSGETAPPRRDSRVGSAARRAAGWIQVGAAAVVWLTLTVVTQSLAGLLLALPFLTCGVICLTVRRHGGLWCAWTWFGWLDSYMRWGTGITWRLVWMTPYYSPEMNYARLAFAWGELLFMLALAAVTVVRLGREKAVEPTRRSRRIWWAGLAALAGICLLQRFVMPLVLAPQWWLASRMLQAALDWLLLGVLTGLLAGIVRGVFKRPA